MGRGFYVPRRLRLRESVRRALAASPLAFSEMSDDFHPGLEGVIAFETEIAEPDREGSALRYRGVDIEELVGRYPFEQVWGLLVDGSFEPGMPHAERIELQDPSGSVDGRPPGRARDARAEVGASAARRHLGRSRRATISPGSRRRRSRSSPRRRAAISAPVPEAEVEQGENAAAQFLIRWRGEADPRHVDGDRHLLGLGRRARPERLDLHARGSPPRPAPTAPRRSRRRSARSPGRCTAARRRACCKMLDEVEASGDADAYVRDLLDRGERIMGFGHRVYRAEDPRARVLRRTAHELGSPRVEVAEALERAALAALREKSPDRVLETNVEFWAAVVLEIAEIPPPMYPAMFGCARVAGWSAHIVEQRRTGRLIRPSARYVGAPAHSLAEA